MTSIPDPGAQRIPVTTSYHGVEVTEDYRWLEEATADRRADWTSEQSRRARDFLDLAAKQNCFDDFIACADHLVQHAFTRRDRLAIMGGSNGGLLMGAVVTQQPDIARAVVAAVPVMDMLRVETTPNGRYNVTKFGSVEDPEMFAALLAYSPYHNVSDGARYPAVLLTGGEFDPRVEAWHPKKMCARLQAATVSDEPILLRMESGGHGLGQSLDREIDLVTDYYAFLFDRLGIAYRPPQG